MTGVRKAFRGISVFCFTIYGCQNFLLRKCMNMQNAVTVLEKTESLRRAFIIGFLSHARADGMRSFRRRHEHSAPQMVSIPARSMAS